MVILSDPEIEELIRRPKLTPLEFVPKLTLKPKPGHLQCNLEIVSEEGLVFCLILRQLKLNPLDFSVILGYQLPGLNRIFRLRRYNGNSHRHTNAIERVTFDSQFHIHTATERYQQLGGDEEGYAQTTTRYNDFDGAIECLLDDCGFPAASYKGPLFSG